MCYVDRAVALLIQYGAQSFPQKGKEKRGEGVGRRKKEIRKGGDEER